MELTVDPGDDLRVHRRSGGFGPGCIFAAIEEDSLGKSEEILSSGGLWE